jgi:protoporphyrinogen oxidase
MKVIIVGAGFTGLAAAIKLLELGHEVALLESEDKAGGLAIGYKAKNWDWSLEKFYHHIFTNDDSIIELAEKVRCPAQFSIPLTSIFRRGKKSQLDSPLSLLLNSEISIIGRLRLAVGLAGLKFLPRSLAIHLEKFTTSKMLPLLVGEEGYRKIWQPLLKAKFGPYQDQVNLAWFWARIAKRTTALGYFEGGFQALADACVRKIETDGGQIRFNYAVKKIDSTKKIVSVDGIKADVVLLTVPAPLVNRLVGPIVSWPKIDYLWGQTLVLELNHSLMKPYWLNILEPDWPFLVAVEHTNFAPAKHYGNSHLIYLGNYLPEGDSRLKLTDRQLLKLYLPYLQKINPKIRPDWIIKATRFQAPFAQPVFPVNYSKQLPSIKTKNSRVFVANMSLVYPWDRGTNYAVELGQKAAQTIAQLDPTN